MTPASCLSNSSPTGGCASPRGPGAACGRGGRIGTAPPFHDEIETVLRHVTDHGAVQSAEIGEKRAETSPPGGPGGLAPVENRARIPVALWHPLRHPARGVPQGLRPDRTRDPARTPGCHVPEPQIIDWACRAALDRLGFATSGELAAFFALVTPCRARGLGRPRARRPGRGRRGGRDRDRARHTPARSCSGPGTLDRLKDLPEAPRRMRLLSPFDPALRDRKRAERLFGFHYRIEIFVPEAQRRYGHYSSRCWRARAIVRAPISPPTCIGRAAPAALWPEPGSPLAQGAKAR